MSKKPTLSLFQGYGIELEYMIVNRKTLAVMPISDLVLKEVAGEIIGEVDLEQTAWSNELVMHVLEMKTRGPAPSLEGLPSIFQQDIVRLNEILAKHDAMLMPTAMHPFFDPETETRLWPHDNAVVYATYNKIFDCRGHGWSNLQSMHINLPFNGDEEFGRLHAAIRLVLPLLPALAASSPMWGGAFHGFLDHRLEFYRHNQKRVPSISGKVIPERAFTKKEYEEKIFARIFADIAPHDPEGTLQDEWLNSRGAIARFDRNAIEIRVLDLQESPRMDLAVATMVVSVVKGLVDGRFASQEAQRAMVEDGLLDIFVACVKDADQAVVKDPAYLRLWGMSGDTPVPASTVWRHLYTELKKVDHYGLGGCSKELQVILERGPLARRILTATGPNPKRESIDKVYHTLAKTLASGESSMAPRRRFDTLLFTCEHGGNQIPARYKREFRGEDKLLATHRGYDIGALPVAKALAKEMEVPLFFSTTSRLVVDLNRSLSHKTAFSEITSPLPETEKDHITAKYYSPYRQDVTDWIQKQIKRNKRVLHLSVHSFTPVLKGEVRNAEIGILYDPKRPLELAFARDLHGQLDGMQDLYRVRRNYPYLGYADGFQTSLRKMFHERLYAGLEIEMNQGIIQERSGQKSMMALFYEAFQALGL